MGTIFLSVVLPFSPDTSFIGGVVGCRKHLTLWGAKKPAGLHVHSSIVSVCVWLSWWPIYQTDSRKHKRFTLNNKTTILEETDKNVRNQKDLAGWLGIPCSTLATILKNRKDIKECVSNCSQKASLKESSYAEVEGSCRFEQWILVWVGLA